VTHYDLAHGYRLPRAGATLKPTGVIRVHNIQSRYRRFAVPFLIVACAVALVAPAGAGAQSGSSDPTAAQYGPPVTPPSQTAGGGQVNDPGQVGALPFTGADVGILAVAAVALLGGGLALRSLSRSRAHD
jgi:hypothetical protein